MANALLDFVMSLVRDPDAAARYAADPAGAIADAQLTDVTSVDVNNLIPMVADSMSASMSWAGPQAGGGQAADANVWTSGAATAAFDAFHAAVPGVPGPVHDVAAVVVPQAAEAGPVPVADLALHDDPAPVPGPDADSQPWLDQPATEWSDTADWQVHRVDDAHAGTEHLGFDLF